MKNKLNKIILIISSILIISILLLAVLGLVNRKGYLSEFKLQSSNDIEYNYHFRLKYYSKIFRNSDIYKVYFDTNEIIQNNNFIKDIKIDKPGSPFGTLVSSKQLKYDEKIDNINYSLRIKPIFYIILFVLILFNVYLCIKYRSLIYDLYNRILENKNIIFKISSIIFFSLIVIFILLSLLGSIPHKGYLSDFELIAESKAGYVYKAKVNSKGLFSHNLIYEYSDKPLKLENKPDYIKNYGYSIEINRMPDWYNTNPQKGLTASAWNNDDGTFTVSNSTSWNSYNYIVPLSVGEIYRISIEIKKLSDYSKGIVTYYLDTKNYNIYIPNTEDITSEYKVYSGDIKIKESFTNEYPHLYFSYPKGVFNVKSIKLEQISDNLYLKNGNEIIVTTTKNINDNPYIGDIKYYTNVNYNIFIKVVIILTIIYLLLLIVLFKKSILYYTSKLKTIFIEKQKIIFRVYGIVLLSFIIITVIFYLLGNMPHKGYLSDFQIIKYSPEGYVYKAKVNSKGLFSSNLIYEYSDKPLKLENKPDYIKNYGYSIEISRMPDIYDGNVGSSAWNNEDGTFTVSNSISYNIYTDQIIPLSDGEKYRVSVEAKRVSGNGGNIIVNLDVQNNNIYLLDSNNIDEEYKEYSSDITIDYTKFNDDYPHLKFLNFNFPNGEINIKHIKIEQIGDNLYLKNDEHILFTSYKVLNNISNIDILFKLNINKIYYIIIFILIFLLYLCYLFSNYILLPSVKMKEVASIKTLSKKDKIFISILSLVILLMFIFHYWLLMPGFFQFNDILESMRQGIVGIYDNWHTVIISVFLNILYKLFGYRSEYLFILNLFLWYSSLYIIILALYLKFRNKYVIFISLLSFLGNIFLVIINPYKDYTASLLFLFSCSLIFFNILVNTKKVYKIINISLSIFFLIIAMLWRHNFIVTVYPVFLFIIFLIVKSKNIGFIKSVKYFINLALLFAFLLVFIHSIFPKIFVKDLYYYKMTGNATFLLQIAGCAVPANDGSMIPENWYFKDKTFEDLKNVYIENSGIFSDPISVPWRNEKVIKTAHLKDLKKVWLKYILKYPNNYIKFTCNFMKFVYNTDTYKHNPENIQVIHNNYNDFIVNDAFKYKKITFTPLKEKIYSFMYNVLPDIKTYLFIILSILIFIFSSYILILMLIKHITIEDTLVYSFFTSFSSIATTTIVGVFLPDASQVVNSYRYIYPIVIITILSLILFITFIYDKGGVRKFIKELRGEK